MHIQFDINQPNIILKKKSEKEKETLAAKPDLNPPKKKEKMVNKSAAITIATLAAVASVCMLSRGFQKNASKILGKMKDYIEEKKDLSSFTTSGNKNKFYDFAIKRINSFIRKSESINNITSLKDILFMKFMYKSEPTKKIHKAITEYFEQISRKTVQNSYKQTEKYFEQMNNIFNKLDEAILKIPSDEVFEFKENSYNRNQLVDLAKEYRDSAMTIVSSFMKKSTMDTRYEHINKVTSTLYSRFWDVSFKDFWSKNNKFKRKEMWQTFIAAEQIKGDKTSLATGISAARNALTCSNGDKAEILSDYISKLDGIVLPTDTEGVDIISKLKWFEKHPDGLRENWERFKNELEKLKNYKIKTSDPNLAKTQEDCKQTYIDIIENIVDENARGELQDMLSIYYKVAPLELDKSGALIAVKKAVKSFDKSVELESVELFDKVRDLRLGSAPTDVLTIIFSFITLSYGLGHAKDNDKRISIMLRSGIPIAGGIMATMYTAARLVSGGKSLAFGFLSGIILNQIGKLVDGIRKSRADIKEEKIEETENTKKKEENNQPISKEKR